MTYPTESTILLGVLGSLGVIATAIIYMYGDNRNQKLELALQRKSQVTESIDPECLD